MPRARNLVALSRRIHENPELGLQERQAADWLGALLRGAGFSVERPIAGLETAFRAGLRGNGARPHVALLAEYDALAGLGHACGHNLICMTSVGAAAARGAHSPGAADGPGHAGGGDHGRQGRHGGSGRLRRG